MKIHPTLINALEAGAVTTLTTTAAVALAGKRQVNNAVAPLNAISHIVWGDEATRKDAPSVKYTLTGTLINASAMAGWAIVNELAFGKINRRFKTAALFTGAAMSGLAYLTDYYAVPKRFTPGIEKRLNRKGMFFVYAVLAASLAVGTLICNRTPQCAGRADQP